VVNDIPWMEQDAERPASTSTVVEYFDVEEPLEILIIADTIEDIDVVKPKPKSKESVVVRLQSIYCDSNVDLTMNGIK
jgi:hypothetical protein